MSSVKPSISGQRLIETINTLSTFGTTDDGGSDRQALSEIELDARAWLIDYALSFGLSVSTDAMANLFIRLDGQTDLPPIMSGSHIDTQPNGGHLDGCYGVLAALECLCSIKQQQIAIKRSIEVVVWTNEEGCRFSPGAMGSRYFVEPEQLNEFLPECDAQGISVESALAACQQRFCNLPLRSSETPDAFVELHIEQGPILEDNNVQLGVVTGIQGVNWYQITCRGASAHAGTTPHNKRQDAMMLAIECVREIEQMCDRIVSDGKRLTFGRWEVKPNALNTIPGEVTFTIDFRHSDSQVLQAFDQQLATLLPASVTHERVFHHAPVAFDSEIVDSLHHSCKVLEQPTLMLESGAFHDAMMLSNVCSTGMLFVPSQDGISHNPKEFTHQEHLINGASVLFNNLISLSNK